MKLLIVGNTGQVARSLAEAADSRGIAFSALGRPQLDLTQFDSVRSAVAAWAPDYVINAAAYTAVDNAEIEIEAAMAVNRDGARTLATACQENGVPVIHLSTDYVFDGSKPEPYTETDPTSPLGVYGRSKLEGENAVSAATASHIILRTAWVYSPFGQNFVKTMLRFAETRDELNVVDDQLGSPTYAPHIADGILQIVEKLDRSEGTNEPWGLFNMAGGGQTTWCGLAQEIFNQSGQCRGPTAVVHPITTDEYPTPTKRPANSRLDCRKLKNKFGIELPNWQTGTRACVTRLIRQTT